MNVSASRKVQDSLSSAGWAWAIFNNNKEEEKYLGLIVIYLHNGQKLILH